MKKNDSFLELVFESLDLALIVLQSYDLISYYNFIFKLKENESNLLITLTKIRLISNMNNNNNIYFKSKVKSQINSVEIKNLQEIIIFLSEILNSEHSQKVLKKISFYYLKKNNQESIFILNHIVSSFNMTNFSTNCFIFDAEKRFTLLFCKNSKKCSEQIYPRMLYLLFKKGIYFLNIYKNLKLIT